MNNSNIQTCKPEPANGYSIFGQLWSSVAATVILGIICCALYPAIVWGIAQTVFPNQANGSLLNRDGGRTTNDTAAVGSDLIGQNFSMPIYFHPRPSAAGAGYDPTSSSGSNLGPLSDKLINGVTQAAAPAAMGTAATTAPTTAPSETLTFDGIRLRTLHYAVDNGISFKLFSVKPDGSRTAVARNQYIDGQGNLNDTALVDAFPHPPTDAADRAVVIASDFQTAGGRSVMIPADAVTASGSGLDPHISPANAQLQAQRVADARKLPVAKVQEMISQSTDQPDLGLLGDPRVNVLRLNLALDAKYPVSAAPASTPK